MLFTSPLFLFVFLPVFIAAYYAVPATSNARNHVALAASVLFFAWGEPLFVFALIAFTYIDYRASLAIAPDSSVSPRLKKVILAAAICLAVAMLIASKYLTFIVAEVLKPQNIKLDVPNIPLYLGISFITFHRISYLVDSYKGRAVPPRHFLDCALYIFLFPQLIAGPIIRYHDIGSQIQHRTHTVEGFLSGFFRFSVGMAKKLIIADPMGGVADKIFALPADGVSFAFAWGGVMAYTLQIYFDFSGYSDMAVGLGRMMGFRFPENFNRPYISRSVTEFWRRWHISLSNWMRVYLYIPLGGNRHSEARTYANLWIVFLISGFWHGASWNFVAWGAYYGLFLSLERAAAVHERFRVALPGLLQQAVTVLIVMVGWVFFRSPTLTYAVKYIGAMFGVEGSGAAPLTPWGFIFGNREMVTLVIACLIAFVPLPAAWSPWRSLQASWAGATGSRGSATLGFEFVATALLLFLCSSAIVSSDYAPFLYFRF
jgi:alginate O-acetyltransferase complex protein AlgI